MSRVLRRLARTVEVVGHRTLQGFLRDRCSQLSAAIAYYAMFAIVPLLTVAVAVLGLVLRDEATRQAFVESILERVPLSGSGQDDLERAVSKLARGESAFGLLALVAIVWSASGVMAAIRNAFSTIFDARPHPPVVGKLVDLGLVLFATAVVGVSFGLTIVVQVAARVDGEALGPFGSSTAWVTVLLGVVVPFLLTTLTFLLLYRVVPRTRLAWGQLLAGAIAGAGLFELLKAGFAYYLQRFSELDAVYGSLGAAMAFLVLVYLSAQTLLFGAELAHAASLPRPPAGPHRPFSEKLRDFLRGLVRDERPPQAPE